MIMWSPFGWNRLFQCSLNWALLRINISLCLGAFSCISEMLKHNHFELNDWDGWLKLSFNRTFDHIMQISRHMHLQRLHANQSVPLRRNHQRWSCSPSSNHSVPAHSPPQTCALVFSSSRTVEEPEAHASCAHSPGTCCSAAAVFFVSRTPVFRIRGCFSIILSASMDANDALRTRHAVTSP